MCTVTFIRSSDKIYITSNRDEKHWRSDAQVPVAHEFSSGKIAFPRDGDAGGSWIALHENGNAIVFLNGGLLKHVPKPPYRKSRGLILLDIIDSFSPFNSFQAINLNRIEPFTAIIWDDQHLFECRWDGRQKHSHALDPFQPHIWSSVTLYDPEVISRRRDWFEEWLGKNDSPEQQDIIRFHLFTGNDDRHNGLRMNRNDKVFTVSVTSMSIGNSSGDLHYLDLKNNQPSVLHMAFDKSMVSR